MFCHCDRADRARVHIHMELHAAVFSMFNEAQGMCERLMVSRQLAYASFTLGGLESSSRYKVMLSINSGFSTARTMRESLSHYVSLLRGEKGPVRAF